MSCYFGILKVGAVVVCVSALLKAREIAYQLDHSDAVAMIAYGGDDMEIGRQAREAFEEVDACRLAWFIGMESYEELIRGGDGDFDSASVSGEATAVILYTSGTTGFPKGAELSHANIIMNVMVMARVKPPLDEGGKTLIALPLFHVMAQTCAMHLAIYNAMTIVLVQRFRAAEVIRLMLDEGITGLHGVPTMYRAILDCEEVTEAEKTMLAGQLESFLAGGASLLPELQKQCMETYSVSMSNGYGLTETSPVSCFHQTSGAIPLGSIGTAAWGVRLKIVDGAGGEVSASEVGEHLVRGHCVMKGYYKDPKATAEVIRDGWYHTGDLARMDRKGHVFIVGRKKDLIIRDGFNVYPAEVEGVLLDPDEEIAIAVGDRVGAGVGVRARIPLVWIVAVPGAGRVRTAETRSILNPRCRRTSASAGSSRPVASAGAKSVLIVMSVLRWRPSGRIAGPVAKLPVLTRECTSGSSSASIAELSALAAGAARARPSTHNPRRPAGICIQETLQARIVPERSFGRPRS